MRLGVLDIGSNTGHLLVVDARGGAAPLPAASYKEPLRLAEHIEDGHVTRVGIEALTEFTRHAMRFAVERGCVETMAFATSAVREADNTDEVLDAVQAETGTRIHVLSGEDEARLTFLAVRRWFGWSAGRLAVFDIGGGSLEIAGGPDESPDVAWSVPLGAARLARRWSTWDLTADRVEDLRLQLRAELARDAGDLLRGGRPDRAAATSKTFRTLARICGAAPSSEGSLVPRVLRRDDLRAWVPRLVAMPPEELPSLPGVSTGRSHQVVPGALVAEAVMDVFDVEELEICPWALREGVILERFDQISVLD
ncbi:Ppx/GppA family phosphatase [Nocardioides yefusunii]|uniref:Ppx/GppA family phosphatase n=1 Tax=Nocardioides yefusunii TaxID=2500546 RepID=A0ABW1QZ97_9ACTN|nr:Ppx/GppA family phosphatase [Nocardioides yefusunii]